MSSDKIKVMKKAVHLSIMIIRIIKIFLKWKGLNNQSTILRN